MRISPNFKEGKEDFYYINVAPQELEIYHRQNGVAYLDFHSDDLTDWIDTIYGFYGGHTNLTVEVTHGKVCAYYHEFPPCWEVYSNRPFPAKDAPQEEWDEYSRYGMTEEAREHFVGYADPFETPEEDLRIDVDVELSLYDAYLMLRAACPNITPQEMLADIKAMHKGGQIERSEIVALNEFLGWLKVTFGSWPMQNGGISRREELDA